MRKPRLTLTQEMVSRAERSFYEHEDMEAAIRAAFDTVPLDNYAIGLLTGCCSLVAIVVPGGVGVFAPNGDPEGFEALGHQARLTFDRRGRHRSVTLTRIEWPPASPGAREEDR